MANRLKSGFNLFISRSKSTGLHLAVWVFRKEEFAIATPSVSVADYNALMYAKNADMLLAAMEKLGPLTRDSKGVKKGEPRLMAAKEFEARFNKRMLASDERLLYRETFLYPFESNTRFSQENGVEEFEPEINKSATRRAIAARDAFGSGLVQALSDWDDVDDYAVYVETLQEWMFVRNMLSVASQLYESVSHGRQHPLRDIERFQYSEKQRILKKPCFMTPITFNTFWRSDSSLESVLDDLKMTYELVNPLRYSMIGEPKPLKGIKGVFKLHSYSSLLGYDNVLFMSYPQATGRGYGFKNVDVVEDLATYLVLPLEDGVSERETAINAFKAIKEVVFSGPNNDWLDVLGGDGVFGRVEGDGDSLLGYGSLIGALWGTMLHHKGYKLVTCQRCHNTVLMSTKGSATKYCSAACRSAAANAKQ